MTQPRTSARMNQMSIQNNCAFWRFASPLQRHAFSNANPRKPVFARIDPANCKTSQ